MEGGKRRAAEGVGEMEDERKRNEVKSLLEAIKSSEVSSLPDVLFSTYRDSVCLGLR